ncbi:PIGW [Blepharisma stoltei]|uniref:Phosphatidylinositol-glycan biosynthesis class W protein n=1 Tax=Blepharisma stoltei TaxID=1481888 RepID=A0AAU9J4U2_9CILI|nr:unnamed protein product [Blepharisma stoltei]
MASYKELKEWFVTGFNGSTQLDIIQVCMFLPAALLLRNISCKSQNFIYDFIFTVIPIIGSVTSTEFNLLKLIILALVCIINSHKLTSPFTNTRPAFEIKDGVKRFQFVTEYRSLMLVATCISILAVDFPIYPRRFVKTETTGVSLMDIGTGSVLFSSALVARSARDPLKPLFQKIKAAMFSCLPLLLIGSLRVIVHKMVDYQEHVSEYGVHWNFFLSLGVVVVAAPFLDGSPMTRVIFSIVIMIFYQILLIFGLEDYIFNGPRDNFFSMNREGILGCIGFFCIYQIGLGLKQLILDSKNYMRNLAYATAFSMIITQILFAFVDPSRRLNNVSYTSWVVSHNLFYLSVVCLAERCVVNCSPNAIIDAINYNQLPYFMLSNLMTGIVNVSMFTLYTPGCLAYFIITLYMFTALSVMWLLLKFHIKLKFW